MDVSKIKLLVQISFSTIVLAFCLMKLTQPNPDSFYWSGVTAILGWWMPSPDGKNPCN